jgi:hypothetical protein
VSCDSSCLWSHSTIPHPLCVLCRNRTRSVAESPSPSYHQTAPSPVSPFLCALAQFSGGGEFPHPIPLLLVQELLPETSRRRFPRVTIAAALIASVSTSLELPCLSIEEPLTIPYSPSCYRKLLMPLPATEASSPPENATIAPVFSPPLVPSLNDEVPCCLTCLAWSRRVPNACPSRVHHTVARLATGGLATRPPCAHSHR